MLNCIICDDNFGALNKLEKMLNKIFLFNDIEGKITFKSSNPDDIIEYVNSHTVNVIILDIDLKSSLTGLQLASKIRETNKSAYIIFVTGHPEYVFLAYQSKTFDFLMKPVTEERMSQTILRLLDDMSSSPKNFISIDKNNKIFVDNNDINYIKKDTMKLVYHTNAKTYETYNSFSKIQSKLPDNFVRCHKSYIVNINNIQDISRDNIIKFKNNDTCEIGPKYKKNLMEVIKNDGNFR